MARSTRALPLLLLVSLVASACGSGSSDDARAENIPTTTVPNDDLASSQLSLDTPDEARSDTDDGTGADTSAGTEEPTAEGAGDESPLDTPLDPGCDAAPSGRFAVNVLLDDADGGLHLRTGAGTSNDILLALPTGTEVEALGGCEVTDTGREWFELQVVTDAELRGWAAADWLDPLTRSACPAGALDLDGLVDQRERFGDFDGDGTTDQMMTGNQEEGGVAIVQVAFADGGYARGEFDIQAGGILPAMRPIGATRDIALVFDGLTSGAATTSHVAVEVADCTVRMFDGVYENGGLTGSGGWCVESTPVGARIWNWSAPATDDLANPPARTWEAVMYHEGGFVPTPALTIDERWCVHPRALGSEPGTTADEPRLVGLAASDPWNLAFAIASELGSGPSTDVFNVEMNPGPDSTGSAVFDLIGFEDDSLSGFRFAFSWEPGEGGIRTSTVTTTAICGRGASADGICV